jgi:hypothetical protein
MAAPADSATTNAAQAAAWDALWRILLAPDDDETLAELEISPADRPCPDDEPAAK